MHILIRSALSASVRGASLDGGGVHISTLAGSYENMLWYRAIGIRWN